MKLHKYIFTFLALCFFSLSSLAQEEQKLKDIVPSRFHFKVSVGIPSLVGNKALRQTFRGTYEGIGNLQLRLVNNLHVGIHGSYTGFGVSGDKIANINTECRTSGAGFNLAYEKFSSPRVFWFVNLAAQYNWMNYYRVEHADSLTPTLHHEALSYRPSAGFCYYSDANFSLGLSVSYTFLMNEFEPYSLFLDNYRAYQKNDSKGITNYFSIGVIINFNLNKELFSGSEESDGEEEN